MKDLSLYEATTPVFIRYLENLDRLLKVAERHAKKHKVKEQTMLESRLAPDMFTLTKQVGYAYFTALETTTNLSGIAAPAFTYDEASFAALHTSLRRVIAFLKKCPKASWANAGRKRVSTFLNPGTKYPARQYVTELALPNFFFHVTTAYDIMRRDGVSLGKDDYLGLS